MSATTSHLTTAQVMQTAGVSFDTINRHIKLGNLEKDEAPGVRGFRFKTSVVNRWVSKFYPHRVKEAAQ